MKKENINQKYENYEKKQRKIKIIENDISRICIILEKVASLMDADAEHDYSADKEYIEYFKNRYNETNSIRFAEELYFSRSKEEYKKDSDSEMGKKCYEAYCAEKTKRELLMNKCYKYKYPNL